MERKKNPIITKNDEFDSICIAKVLLDELDNIPFVQTDEIYWTLKQLVKMRNSIVENNIENKNKFHAQILSTFQHCSVLTLPNKFTLFVQVPFLYFSIGCYFLELARLRLLLNKFYL